MIDKNQLSQLIISSIRNQTDTNNIHSKISQTISSYLIKNLQILGTYIGTLPTVPPLPDPMSNVYKFKLSRCDINSDLLVSASSININSWYKIIINAIKTTSLISTMSSMSIVKLPTEFPIFISIFSSDIDVSNKKNMQEIWQSISNILVNDIKNSTPIISSPATSSSGGTGVVNFIKFI